MADTDIVADVPDAGWGDTAPVPYPSAGWLSPPPVKGALPQPPAARGASDIVRDVEGITQRGEQVTGELADMKRRQMAQQSYVDRQQEARLEEDRGRMSRAYEAEGQAKNSLPPKWDADKERQERLRGPMEQFGSIGSVFAMAASLFTKTPMTSALNAGAAAMKAMQEHDQKGYDSAYQAWKDNTQLALKRFDMERALFEDANKLVTTDLNAWRAKTAANAARFGDEKTLLMLQNGMDADVLEVQSKAIDARVKLQKAYEGQIEFDTKHRLIEEGKRAFEAANPNATMEEKYLNALENIQQVTGAQKGMMPRTISAETQFMNGLVPELMKPVDQGGMGMSFGDAMTEARKRWQVSKGGGVGGNTDLTTDRQRAADVKKYRDSLAAETNADGSRKYSDAQIAEMAAQRDRELKERASPLTANQRHKIEEKQRHIESVVNQIEKAKSLITEATRAGQSVVGVRGAVGRIKEFALGGGTYQSEFEELIRTIQREVKPIISGTTRLSKEDQVVIDTIVPGLGFLRNHEQALAGLTQLQNILQKKDLLEDPSKPTFVEQNGWIFERQEDGSMKPIKKAK